MHVSSSVLALALAVSAMAAGPAGISRRQVSCTTEDGGKGVCQSSTLACSSAPVEGLCSAPNTLCCVASPDDSATAADGGDDGEVETPDDGVVPEEEAKKEAAEAEAAAGASLTRRAPNGGVWVYSWAAKWLGRPYVWGGGNCQGPTKGGFDCSGLVLYAVCRVTGKKLPHKAQAQYKSPLGKKIPRVLAKRGDTIYWATDGKCNSAIKHVAIVRDAVYMINASGKGKHVKVQKIWTKSGNLKICPYAVRFW